MCISWKKSEALDRKRPDFLEKTVGRNIDTTYDSHESSERCRGAVDEASIILENNIYCH